MDLLTGLCLGDSGGSISGCLQFWGGNNGSHLRVKKYSIHQKGLNNEGVDAD